jgi:hypothetical protein
LRATSAAAIVGPRYPQESVVPSLFVASLVALLLALPAAAAEPAAVACGSQSRVPAEQRVTNTARWTTASEQENFGYDVYRGESEKGPFVKLTRQPILGNGTTNETHEYSYTDDAIDPCQDYWYYVEAIATDGTREKFTTVFHAPAKRHAVTPPASAVGH